MNRFPAIAAALTLTLALDLATGSPASASRRTDQPTQPTAAALSAPAPEAARLTERRRFTVDAPVKELASKITFSNGIEFDTRSGEPSIPDALRSSVPAPGERMSLLVQVQAPLQSEWASELQRAGAQVVSYIPNYAFLVRINSEQRGAIAALPFVRWTGLYHTAYRISAQDEMRLRSGRGRYQVLLFNDGNIADVAATVTALGGVVEDTSSRVNRIVRIELDRANVDALASHPDVQWIEPREEFHVMNDQVQWVDQTSLVGNRKIWDMGLKGAGQVVMMGDSGIRTNHNQFRDPLVPITTFGDYPTHRKVIAYLRAADTSQILFGDAAGASYHGTHTSCTIAGSDDPLAADLHDGMAKEAKIYFLDAGGSTNSIITPGDLNDYFQPAYTGNGGGAARVSSNSWGSDTNGAYTITCMSTDQFAYAHPDFLISFSNGNAGSAGSVGSPAAAKNILSAGGTQNGVSQNLIYSGTSRGPTDDSRFKPTVCSPGQNVISASGASNTTYVGLTGTSMASPNLAGSATLVRQYFTDGWYPTGAAVPANALTPSAALLRAMMVNSGTDDFAAFTMPDNNIGWGRILLDDVLFFPGDARRTLVLDESDGVTTGEVREYEVFVTDASQPLEITLVWTDPASSPSASINLVNDLDLIVKEGANTYLGNVWAGGQSVTGGSGDNRNVEENFRRATPVVGKYTIQVEGSNVPFGPAAYAIVVTGGVGGSAGVVFLDKSSYGPSATVGVHVEDADGGPSVSVALSSPSEPGGESFSFGGANGVYEGSVPLTLASANGSDGKLSVSQGDVITVTYTDSSPAHVATATATVDADDPTLTNVAVDPADITAIVTWTTSGLADSRVEYGTTTGLGTLSTLDPALVTSHSHQLTGLSPETTYYFDVLSRDHQGNLVRDNFGGMHYRFTTSRRADVLLVLADESTTDRTYRYDDALKATGWTYNTWGRPLADNPPVGNSTSGMRSFKAVWWQVGWEQYPPFSNPQRDSVTALHDGGARIAFVSHDVAWAFTDPSSGYQDAARTAWFNNTMHSLWQFDPTTWATNTGIALDPISGAYTGGVPYTPFRAGGAGDEVDKIDGAGTGAYVWRDTDGTPDDISVRWESSANLGTPGIGVWGGQKTRTVSMFLEWLQFNAAVENDATRAAILDKTLIYLIGGDHPDATVLGPNGGENFTTSPVSISWSSTTDTGNGRNLASTRLEYSDDGGSSWTLITTSPGASPYSWNVSALPSAATYRVRVIVADDGSPSLSGSDASNANFTINIPGNETRGPVVLAGSPGVSPTPITIPNPATLVATISDALTGASNVTQAEWSVGVSPAPAGTGTAMTGAFGTVQVAVSAALPTPSLPTGAQTLWIRGRDSVGNWGPAGSLAVQVNGGTTDAGLADVAVAFSLGQNFPNPFEKGTAIRFALPTAEDVNLKVFNVQGRLVRTLLEGHRGAGRHVVNWDGRDDTGNAVASGVYFYRLKAGSREAERRMTYLR